MTGQGINNVGRKLMLALLVIFGFLVVGFLIMISSVPTVPRGANDAAAASSLRIIYLANVAYAKNHPHEGFARRLGDLSEGPGNTEHFWTIDPTLASGEKHGYRFTYSSQSIRGDDKIDAYQVFADPLVPDKTGRHHLFVNETGIIRGTYGGQANAGSDPIQ